MGMWRNGSELWTQLRNRRPGHLSRPWPARRGHGAGGSASFLQAAAGAGGEVTKSKKSARDVYESVPEIRSELVRQPRIARYIDKEGLAGQVEKVYQEMTGQSFPKDVKAAAAARLRHKDAHALDSVSARLKLIWPGPHCARIYYALRDRVLLAAVIAMAQQAAAVHRGHVDARYKMTPMPAPKLMTGIGTSPLKITTKSREAQAYFSQGMELLHCFWDFEAYRRV